MKLKSCLLLAGALWSCGRADSDPAPLPSVPVPTYAGPPSATEAVIYEVNVRALQPNPTFAGVTARLDSIKRLGANVVWLMPIYPVGQVRKLAPLGSPYSVQNYRAVNPEFGTAADFRALVAAAHARGMAVMLDWVANHTAWDNPWITRHPDWYTKDGAGNIIWPAGTNWQDVADLDYGTTPMRDSMVAAMQYWVTTYNVDGFRCDAADMVPYDFWRQAITALRALPNRRLLLLAEGARSDHFAAGFEMNYAWDYYNQLKSVFRANTPASALLTAHTNEYRNLPTGARKLRFTTNHDETAWDETPVSLFGGPDGAVAASVAALYMGGTPLLYNGQEVGCPVKLPLFDRSTINWSANPAMLLAYRRLLTFYKESPALRFGTLVPYPDADVLAFERQHGTERVLVLVNVRNRPATLALPTVLAGTTWQNALTTEAPVTLSGTLPLGAYEWRVLVRK